MWGVVIFTPILWSLSIMLPQKIIEWRTTIYGVILIVIILLHAEGAIDKALVRNFGNKGQLLLKRLIPKKKTNKARKKYIE